MTGVRRIGEVARLTGMSVSAIRYYEEEGLLAPAMRTEAGYRLYEEEAISRLRFIRRAKASGLRLTDIAEILRSPDAASERDALRQRIAHRLDEVRRQVEELEAFESSLQRLFVQTVEEPCGCRHLGDCGAVDGERTHEPVHALPLAERGGCACCA
ncbi:MAG TPA: MerR family transcriptional regulator [Candidatus Dormibacteraeota bacterium]|nr:MerR family transcriptional regulator [Candidatus Dormibacteraeota bacterium]